MAKGIEIIIKEDVYARRMGNKVLILNPENNKRYILNDIGVQIWNYISQNKALGEGIEEIAKDYATNKEKVAIDVHRFLKQLEKENILKLRDTE